MKPKVKYDKKVNILSLRIGKKRSVDSEVQGNIVVDYDENGNVVNIDIMDISIAEFSKVREFARSGAFAALKTT